MPRLLYVKTPAKADVAGLRDLEPVFHRSEPGSSRAVFEAMTTDDDWEVGASGTVYHREEVLDIVAARYASGAIGPAGSMIVEDFAAHRLADGVILVTYRVLQPQRVTRRAAMWVHDGNGWKAARCCPFCPMPSTAPSRRTCHQTLRHRSPHW
jgi:hypothetical protein